MGTVINVRQLSFAIGRTEILHSCSLEVCKGEIMCIMGPNGCGKTTLLNCILGFNDLPKGAVFINGTDIRTMRRNIIARSVSYVQQAADNESSLKVFDYLLIGRIAHKRLYENPDDTDCKIVNESLEKLNIGHMQNKCMTDLSGGEKQLVMIAKALVQDTDIIIMDEPASALDFGNQAKLLNLLRRLNEAGKTIIFTTHNPNHALALDSKVCIMKAGCVNTVGTAAECITPEKMRGIYGEGLEFINSETGVSCTFVIKQERSVN